MQLWVSKLNKNKWKIALIILSVAIATSCLFGVTTAWFTKVESDKMNVSMDTRYVDIFIDAGGNNTSKEMIPSQSVEIVSPKAVIREMSGMYCVFVQVSEIGGTSGHTYLEYTAASGWTKLTAQQIAEFNFPVKEDTAYYYRVADASVDISFEVLNPTVTVTKDTTYKQIKEAWEGNSPVKLQCVAAGCETKQNGLATKEEVAYAEVYSAFIG